MLKTNFIYDCVIIGGGPAGLTAAIYLARFKRKIAILDANNSRALLIPRTHNYPGKPNGITGELLLKDMKAQLQRYLPKIENTIATEIRKTKQSLFKIDTKSKQISAKTIILATGIVDIEPKISNLENAIKEKYIRHCPVCDGYEAMNKKIAVIGYGNSALKQAILLRRYSKHVTLLSAHQEIKFTKKEMSLIMQHGIKVVSDPIDKVRIKGKKIKALVINKKVFAFDTIYSALGIKANNELAYQLGVKCDGEGYILVDDHQETNVKNVFAIGDIVAGLGQLCVATGQGAIAACAVNQHLNSRERMIA